MRLLVLLLIIIPKSLSIWCIDGTDCDLNCGICEGAGCLRIIGQHPTKGPSIALTCLPHDAYIHLTHPEGCRTDLATHKKTCLCLDTDFCNGAKLYQNLVIVFSIILIYLFH